MVVSISLWRSLNSKFKAVGYFATILTTEDSPNRCFECNTLGDRHSLFYYASCIFLSWVCARSFSWTYLRPQIIAIGPCFLWHQYNVVEFVQWRDKLPARSTFIWYVRILAMLNWTSLLGTILLSAGRVQGTFLRVPWSCKVPTGEQGTCNNCNDLRVYAWCDNRLSVVFHYLLVSTLAVCGSMPQFLSSICAWNSI